MLDLLRQTGPLVGPLVAAVFTVLGFIQRRSPASRLRGHALEIAELIEKTNSRGHVDLNDELEAYLSDLRAEYHLLRVRRLSGVTVITIIFVALVAGGAIGGAIAIGTWWAWLLAIPIALFCLGLEAAGVRQLYQVDPQDSISPTRAYRTKPKST